MYNAKKNNRILGWSGWGKMRQSRSVLSNEKNPDPPNILLFFFGGVL
jgi:hypothetical protein